MGSQGKPQSLGSKAEHTWVIAQQEMQNGSGALPAGAGQLLLALVHGFFRSNWPDLSQT